MKMKTKKYQIVFWRLWQGFHFVKITKGKHGYLHYIYKWAIYLGFIEIRRWQEDAK